MFRWLFGLFIFISISAQSIELTVNYTESSFLGFYKHQTYIKSGQYTHIDEHYKMDETGLDVIPYVPDVYSLSLSKEQANSLIEKLIKLGVNDWEKQYPENIAGLICDGPSFNLYIKSEKLNINSKGYCYFPESYKKVAAVFESVHKTPNKKINQD